MAGLPRLIPTIRRVERAVGQRLEDVVETGQLTEPLLKLASIGRSVDGAIERVRAGVVHALYLPTRRDVRRLSATVARLEAVVNELSLSSEERDGELP